jgi:hypothetical protein
MVDPSEKMKNLRNKINDAEGYLVVIPEYNRGPSGWINVWTVTIRSIIILINKAIILSKM